MTVQAPVPHPHRTGAHLQAGSDALKQAAVATLAEQGVQWTDLRETVFDALAGGSSGGGAPVSAYDVADRVSAATGRRIAANSVYRILDLFVAHNLAKRVESRNAYVVNVHPSCSHDCIFLVCEDCGQIAHLDDDKLADGMRSRARTAGFTPRRPVLELMGLCSACNGAAQTGNA
ncbi:transcriptional repressor [Sandaracinobacter neustonicus]|uniref:Transcriptional repressor n=1 Tax=Sandaracinobacter neustonicus TaxID=1715348 RepID=A0A501XK65_9SPHN|nr:transcriptional repressor [Sandaracinobacter neustonicus]TPE61072.1 transcriptional repressor [Sandaracinobacter neustonicus]